MNSMSGVKLRKYILFGINTVYLLILPITDASVQKNPTGILITYYPLIRKILKFLFYAILRKEKLKSTVLVLRTT